MRAAVRFARTTLFALAAVLAPCAARAESPHVEAVNADFDGDGIRDGIELGARATELDVRLSTTRAMQRLRADDLIVRFVVADVDRDGEPDVVANTSRSGLRVWMNKGRGLFSAHSGRPHNRRWPARAVIRGVPVQDGDSACTDCPRHLIASSAPRGEEPGVARRALLLSPAHQPEVAFPRRIPRGPPFASPHVHAVSAC